MRTKNILLILMAVCTISSSYILMKTTESYEEAAVENISLQSDISKLNKTVTELEHEKTVLEASRDALDELCMQYEDELETIVSKVNLLNETKSGNSGRIDYTEEDVYLLASVMYAENGCDWFPSVVQLMTGSVVLNRIKHEFYPDNLYDVIHQPGQYGCVSNGAYNVAPSEEAISNARYLLENGSILPDDVLYQSGVPQGSGVYFEFYDPVLGITNYFCYQ